MAILRQVKAQMIPFCTTSLVHLHSQRILLASGSIPCNWEPPERPIRLPLRASFFSCFVTIYINPTLSTLQVRALEGHQESVVVNQGDTTISPSAQNSSNASGLSDNSFSLDLSP